jgi:CHAT domain-containing protein
VPGGPALELRWKIYDAERAEQRGDWPAAVTAYEEAADMQATLASVQSSRVLMERVLGDTYDLGSRLAYARVQIADLRGAVAALENSRARLLTSRLARAAYQATVTSGRGSALPEPYERILRQVEQFELIRDSGLPDTPEGTTIQQRALSAALERMAEDVRRVPGFEHFGLPQSAGSVPGLLSGMNIAYLFSTEHGGYALLHLRKRDGALVPVPLPDLTFSRVQEEAVSFVTALGTLEADYEAAARQVDDVCQWLGSAVIAPLLPTLGEAAGAQIAVVACGWFSVLPVHAASIPDRASPDGRRYPLIDRAIAYVPNAQVLRAVAALPQTSMARDVLVVAEPRSASPDLPNSVAEADAVQRVWPASRRAWRKQDVLDALPQCTLAHFATHGTSRAGAPLKSSIKVAAGSSIEVHELMAMLFRSAPLCVLSACDTAAVGQTVPDELTGLVSGLLSARARGVIGAMWPVDDAATRVLMTLLHQGLREVHDGRIALSLAQSRMRAMTIRELREIAPDVAASGDFDGPPAARPFTLLDWAGFCYTGA